MGCNPSKDGGAVVGEGVGGDGGGGEVTNKLSSAAESDSAETLLIPLSDDSGERDSLTSSVSEEENSDTMKTSEEVADFEKEFRPDDVELCHAATKIQASFRGHMTRKQQAGGKDEPGATASGLTSKDESLESQLKNVDINKDADLDQLLDVDLADPELHKAATKIQASFRGHKARKADDAIDAKQ
ncbi:uncharacterized protein LOC111037474 isoform X2 [Myzus persicae]|uniref:uncharacterized protein LOC111037474 isoform X2 n=1 Tax=Myzus persicae TaxID=13164 RepID=UPI000B9313CD|nr:uncharacterized protein LOC111037474 isoform X2 [Myzus persicae]